MCNDLHFDKKSCLAKNASAISIIHVFASTIFFFCSAFVALLAHLECNLCPLNAISQFNHWLLRRWVKVAALEDTLLFQDWNDVARSSSFRSNSIHPRPLNHTWMISINRKVHLRFADVECRSQSHYSDYLVVCFKSFVISKANSDWFEMNQNYYKQMLLLMMIIMMIIIWISYLMSCHWAIVLFHMHNS